jgi:dihydrofolate reductase
MRMRRVEGILAVSKNNVIGQGDKIPWHHSGDFKRFKQITMGHGVMMGYPTFKGMAKLYTRPGKQVLPGRHIFVVGREPFEGMLDLDVDFANVSVITSNGPQDDIMTALKRLPSENEKLFIAGGARVYHNYLPYAERVHLTRIMIDCPEDHETVRLSAETHWLLSGLDRWRSITMNGYEDCDGVRASYMTLDSAF